MMADPLLDVTRFVFPGDDALYVREEDYAELVERAERAERVVEAAAVLTACSTCRLRLLQKHDAINAHLTPLDKALAAHYQGE